MKHRYIVAAAIALIADSASADSPFVEGITPNISIGFEFGAAPAPSAVSRLTAAFALNSRVLRPTLARMGSPAGDVEDDILLAGRGTPILTLFDFSTTPAGVDSVHALGKNLLARSK